MSIKWRFFPTGGNLGYTFIWCENRPLLRTQTHKCRWPSILPGKAHTLFRSLRDHERGDRGDIVLRALASGFPAKPRKAAPRTLGGVSLCRSRLNTALSPPPAWLRPGRQDMGDVTFVKNTSCKKNYVLGRQHAAWQLW